MWHDEIERDDVGLERSDFLQRLEPIRGDAHDLDARLGVERLAQDFAGERRVVHHQHTDTLRTSHDTLR